MKSIKKKCPNCGLQSFRLYQNKSREGKRKWIPIAWHCSNCSYTYQIISDTLVYKIGEESADNKNNKKCPKCDKKMVRIYRHKNPTKGEQKWISMGNFCSRCKYVWMDKEY